MKFSIFFVKIILYGQILTIKLTVMLLKREKLIQKLLLIAAFTCFIIAGLLILWIFISEINFFEDKFIQYLTWLDDIEYKVSAIENRWQTVLVVLLLYFILTVFPVFPIAILCVATGMVFSVHAAIVINLLGLIIMFSAPYYIGYKSKSNGVQSLVRKNSIVRRLIESEGQGNPWLLLVIRLLPAMPISPVSNLYGAMKFPFYKYLAISVAGFLPKVISYFVIGYNLYNPFSAKLSLPLIFMTVFMGILFLVIRGGWEVINMIKEHK